MEKTCSQCRRRAAPLRRHGRPTAGTGVALARSQGVEEGGERREKEWRKKASRHTGLKQLQVKKEVQKGMTAEGPVVSYNHQAPAAVNAGAVWDVDRAAGSRRGRAARQRIQHIRRQEGHGHQRQLPAERARHNAPVLPPPPPVVPDQVCCARRADAVVAPREHRPAAAIRLHRLQADAALQGAAKAVVALGRGPHCRVRGAARGGVLQAGAAGTKSSAAAKFLSWSCLPTLCPPLQASTHPRAPPACPEAGS